MSRRWLLVVTSLVLCHTFVTAAVAQESTVHTLFGNWFGKKDNSSSQQDDRYSQRGWSRQMSDSTEDRHAAVVSFANEPNAAGPGERNRSAPWPRRFAAAEKGFCNRPTNGSTVKDRHDFAERVKDRLSRTALNATTRAGQTLRPSTSRQLNVSAPTSTPSVSPDPNSTNNSNTTSTPSATRQSPSRRTAPHINPSDLRNELSGSFPNPVDTGEPVARTARADEHSNAASNDACHGKAERCRRQFERDRRPHSYRRRSRSNELPMPILEKSATSPQPSEQLKNEARPIESEPRSAAEAFGAKPETQPGAGASRFVRTPYSTRLPLVRKPRVEKKPSAKRSRLPAAAIRMYWPRTKRRSSTPIFAARSKSSSAAKPCTACGLQNQSDVPAEGIVATVKIPAGADVMNATATQGMVQQSQDAQSKGQMQWQIARLDRRAGETLEVRIIPRENRPLELGITWTVAPVGSRAVVEVQEPKLQLEVAGPNEVYFDRPQVFKLTISNPGTGPAENVKIELLPPGSKEGAAKETATSHPLGDLPPGGSQTVEVELTAREAGKMFVKAMATAEGGLTSQCFERSLLPQA